MKTIHLIRHAKSSWRDSSLADIDRPLKQRGIADCQLVAAHILAAGCQFNHVFCSLAQRAIQTIDIIIKQLPQLNIEWQTAHSLYTFDSSDLHKWCRQLDDSINEIVLVGHNPAFTDFCNELCSSDIKNIPTCGYVQLSSVDSLNWLQVSEKDFELISFVRPKQLRTTSTNKL